ncbi:hypothetical protein SARC_03673 [Sphaeroforma arctica JP610]|uniref:E2 ubiquitin-conjugating enzyme n=1 Tax=Sphaeroforma arctica JP610 TaxID=667725 RepID=A0A0L0G7C4_9EUKA|nr:hypothetical protein SARC_03673 [Sphaeroforma arctica JP610]KNC84108.1 hypothetical protein SARC_03673 [Sphaeroforma arctica JP610]|eukprot:XP_014158010.1 hypothetical protein SARC_03673 [Sphaeroforma arctica JP610]
MPKSKSSKSRTTTTKSDVSNVKAVTLARLNKEMLQITIEPPKNCTASFINDNLMEWRATIVGPDGTPYEGGVFILKLSFSDRHPFVPPKVTFMTRIFHCNISAKGEICLDILKDKWNPFLTVSKILLSIGVLLECPNPDDPLEPEIAHLWRTNRELHDAQAVAWTEQHAK